MLPLYLNRVQSQGSNEWNVTTRNEPRSTIREPLLIQPLSSSNVDLIKSKIAMLDFAARLTPTTKISVDFLPRDTRPCCQRTIFSSLTRLLSVYFLQRPKVDCVMHRLQSPFKIMAPQSVTHKKSHILHLLVKVIVAP